MKTFTATERYRLNRIANARGAFACSASAMQTRTPQQRAQWQGEFRREFARVLGDLDRWQRPELEPQTLGVQQCDGYRRETIAFTSRPALQALGHFLIPDEISSPRAAILCLPGHGRGMDGNVGLKLDGSPRAPDEADETDAYARDFPLQCVQRGYPTFVLELIGFGHRRDSQAQQGNPNTSSCTRDSMAALMLGESMAGWRVWDAMRALDYLQSRSEIVDTNRLATMGISGGGLVSLFCAALDTRVKACVVSCYFNTFEGSVLAVEHCVDNFVPGLLNLCEMPDLAALIAPRALFCESGSEDQIFPIETSKIAIAQAEEIFANFDANSQFGSEIFAGGHQFHGVAAFAFLEQKLAM